MGNFHYAMSRISYSRFCGTALCLAKLKDTDMAPILQAYFNELNRGRGACGQPGRLCKAVCCRAGPRQACILWVSYAEIADSLEKANVSIGADFIQRFGEPYLVRGDARPHGADEIGRAVIASRNGVPVSVRDLATVRIGGELRRGAASRNGNETVVGSALMLVGANRRTVASAAGEKLKDIDHTLPAGINIVPMLDRSQLVVATSPVAGRAGAMIAWLRTLT
jgi:hypothetical protein